jgi:hypothetical protein
VPIKAGNKQTNNKENVSEFPKSDTQLHKKHFSLLRVPDPLTAPLTVTLRGGLFPALHSPQTSPALLANSCAWAAVVGRKKVKEEEEEEEDERN